MPLTDVAPRYVVPPVLSYDLMALYNRLLLLLLMYKYNDN